MHNGCFPSFLAVLKCMDYLHERQQQNWTLHCLSTAMRELLTATNSTKIRIQIVQRATSNKTNCSERSIHRVPTWKIITGKNCIPTYSTTMTMILLFWDLKSQSSILAWAYTYICPVQSRQNTQNRKLLLTSSSKSLHSSQKY